MDKEKESVKKANKKPRRARTAEARENQLISLAFDLAEEKLRNGTASSQIIAALLNLGTSKHKLELERMRKDLEVSDAKIEQMKNQETGRELMEEAIKAFRTYSGQPEEDDYDEENEDY